MAKDVAGAVDARAFAVPHAEDAVIGAVAMEIDLLGSPKGGGRHVLVDAGLGDDVMGVEMAFGDRHLLIEIAERRAAVAGDVAGRVVTRRQIARALHHRQADQGLDAGQIDTAAGLGVFVVEFNLLQGHVGAPR